MEQPAVKAKDCWYDQYGKIRILATADGYAMVRRPWAAPFVEDIKTIRKNWVHEDNITIQQP